MKLRTSFEVDLSLLVLIAVSLVAITLSVFAAVYKIDKSMILSSIGSGAFSAVLAQARITYGRIVFIDSAKMTMFLTVGLIANISIAVISFYALRHAGFF